MADQPRAVIGCLLDVSDSMREALEVGRSDEGEIDRLRAVLRAALQIARTEHRRSPDTLMFVGIFGLNEAARCPPVVDLCGAVDALLDIRGDEAGSGHNRLIALASENNRAYIDKYIRTKLTEDEAHILAKHLTQNRARVQEFVDDIPTEEENLQARRQGANAGKILGIVGGIAITGMVISPVGPVGALVAAGGYLLGDKTAQIKADKVENAKVDNSKALKLAHDVWDEWWQSFARFEPRLVSDVVSLLERLHDYSESTESGDSEEQTAEEQRITPVLDTLRRYIYGRTPLKEALRRSIDAFESFRHQTTVKRRVLILVSDGHSTDGNPVELAEELTRTENEEERVTLAVIHLTSNPAIPRRRLYAHEATGWDMGQRTLFGMASKAAGDVHPVPVLASMGWKIPSCGEFALYASLCSATALNEFCSLLLSARFGSANAVLDFVGRINLDAYISDAHILTHKNPSDQEDKMTCYAHATAAVLYMALLRVVGREGGYPSIEDLRHRIEMEFPPGPHGRSVEEVLEKATNSAWCRPLLFREVDVKGARDAVLRRRPVLTTFDLSKPGWQSFSQHFQTEATKNSVLTAQDMEAHRSAASGGGHAVVLIGCGPNSLTFLHSWGHDWGDGGKFSVEDHTVLEIDGRPVCFYDVYWLESDLTESERRAFDCRADKIVRSHAAKYPSIFDFEARCPLCSDSAPIANFTGNVRQAVCPHCSRSFAPEPGHLLQAL
ncbi:hypothetical protein EDB80DRAFT_713833 [Ilyonectria destructans]|nr:hypothetical protein EDB80DRAFT_713833 [Ilyonectria destructans]